MSDDMDSTCWSTYWTRCLRKALAAWPMQLILPSPFDETQTPDSLRIGLSENACFAMPVSDFRQKTTRSLICPTTFQAREARSLRSLVQSASSTASTPGTVSNVSNVSKSSLLEPTSKHQSTCLLAVFESILHALQSLCMPAHMTSCTTCTSKESNIDQSW